MEEFIYIFFQISVTFHNKWFPYLAITLFMFTLGLDFIVKLIYWTNEFPFFRRKCLWIYIWSQDVWQLYRFTARNAFSSNFVYFFYEAITVLVLSCLCSLFFCHFLLHNAFHCKSDVHDQHSYAYLKS